ncbi:NAD(P)-binding Rossmann-fold superfamily protein [Rhynchospora pubera]|uniref:NAD(P)-binding Rossmann-fold superfamily protein n=1 Tax=Rhynchospora pubera TaxID=906938 RepID=A0AAV8CC53_9POAL|nr:NAD(P)-binding Rossmann-fold superfamily protein [Rhynchospora pubera]
MAISGDGPVVLITGCTDGGIGHALALEFARRGCSVVATSRAVESMKALQGVGPNIWLRALDVRSEANIRETVEGVVGELGRIDVLVNNAGVHLVAPLAEAPMDSFHTIFDTNVYGPMRLIQAVAPHMIQRRQGKIVNVGSVTALAPGPWAGVYSASKSALHALSDTLRLELRSFGISVTTVAPGAISSNLGHSSLQTYDKIADWKFYKEFESTIRARTDISQGPKSTPAHVFAKKMVASVLNKNPPRWFSYGRFSTILAILYYLPLSIRDYFYRLVFKC